ncbi:MAG: winged helix-turn-helix transcriptional regulator [Halobacteriales archaeon]|nr:winged helix-turn-helix transcriptional regulator [Halobacteriales archaeon]
MRVPLLAASLLLALVAVSVAASAADLQGVAEPSASAPEFPGSSASSPPPSAPPSAAPPPAVLPSGSGAPSNPGVPPPANSPIAPPSLGGGALSFGSDVMWISVSIGVGLAGFAAWSLLGTRFVNSENVLENDARRAIFEYIKTNPGCHLRETAGALQLSTTNVLWHLRKLEESNLVNGKKLEGYKVFYPVEGGIEAKRMGLALAVLRNPNATQVLGIIARNPGVHQREIARMLDVNHGTVRWHLKKLSLVQLVLEVKRGSVSQYFVSALGLQALERVEVRAAQVAQVAQPPAVPEVVQVVGPDPAEA